MLRNLTSSPPQRRGYQRQNILSWITHNRLEQKDWLVSHAKSASADYKKIPSDLFFKLINQEKNASSVSVFIVFTSLVSFRFYFFKTVIKKWSVVVLVRFFFERESFSLPNCTGPGPNRTGHIHSVILAPSQVCRTSLSTCCFPHKARTPHSW